MCSQITRPSARVSAGWLHEQGCERSHQTCGQDARRSYKSGLVPTLKIPPVLRPSTGGEKELAAEGETVGDALRSLAEQHPDTKAQLFSGEGELNRYVNVYLNDEDVRVLDGLETAVGERDTLVILPAMAGG